MQIQPIKSSTIHLMNPNVMLQRTNSGYPNISHKTFFFCRSFTPFLFPPSFFLKIFSFFATQENTIQMEICKRRQKCGYLLNPVSNKAKSLRNEQTGNMERWWKKWKMLISKKNEPGRWVRVRQIIGVAADTPNTWCQRKAGHGDGWAPMTQQLWRPDSLQAVGRLLESWGAGGEGGRVGQGWNGRGREGRTSTRVETEATVERVGQGSGGHTWKSRLQTDRRG